MGWTPPPSNVAWSLGGIFILLSLATLTVHGLAVRYPQQDYTELKQRVNAWWVIALIFSLTLLLHRLTALLFLGFLSFIALKEYLSLIPTRRADRRVLFWCYLAIFFQYYWIAIAWYGMFIIFIPVYVFLFLPMRMVMLQETQGFLRAVGTLHWGLMLTVYNLSHVAYLLMLPPNPKVVSGGSGLYLYLIFLTALNDIAQYVWGKGLGKRKVLEKVSPKKTWLGLLGGMATTVIMALVLSPWLTPFSLDRAAEIGLLIGLVGFVGDVTVSALKRDLGVKDSGNIIPGHGGILDRIDSLTYTAPVFFHFTIYFYYPGLLN